MKLLCGGQWKGGEEGGKVRSGKGGSISRHATASNPDSSRPSCSSDSKLEACNPRVSIISIYLKECHLAYICLYAR